MTTPSEEKRGRPPRRQVDPDTGKPRVFWNGGPLGPDGNPVPDPGELDAAPEDEDEDDLEEDEDDLEDEDDEDELEAAAPPPRQAGPPVPMPPLPEAPPGDEGPLPDLNAPGDDDRPPPPRRPPPRRRPAQEPGQPFVSARKAREAQEEVDKVMSALDVPRERVGCTLMRKKPQLWKGKDIVGWVGRFNELLPTEEIKNTYGGGEYEWFIYGPDPKNPQHTKLLDRVAVKISGDPIVADEASSKPAEIELVKEIIQRSTREVEATRKEMAQMRENSEAAVRNAQKENGTAMRDVLEVMSKVMNPAANQQALVQQQQTFEQRLASIEEKRARDDAQREERRLKEEEAKERRHREQMDAQDKRHQETLVQMRLAHEKDMARIQAETARMLETVKSSESNGGKFTEMMLQLTQKMSSDNESRMMQFVQLMQANAIATSSATKAAEEAKTDFMLKVLMDKKEDPIESMLKMKKVMDVFSGEKGDTSMWREVLDGVKDAAPGILAALRPGQAAAPAAQTIAPGSVATVELDQPALLPAARKRKGKFRRAAAAAAQPEATPAAPAAPAPATPVATAVAAAAAVVDVVGTTVEAFTPQFPPDGMSPQESIKLLVTDIELALKADWEEDRVFAEVVQKFPAGILALLKLATPDMAVDEISKGVPGDWLIGTPRGRQMVRRLVERVVAA